MADNDIVRAQNELSKLNKKLSDLGNKENKENEKARKATDAAQKASSNSTFNSKLKDVERANKEVAKIQKTKSDVLKKIGVQTAKLHKYQTAKPKRMARN